MEIIEELNDLSFKKEMISIHGSFEAYLDFLEYSDEILDYIDFE